MISTKDIALQLHLIWQDVAAAYATLVEQSPAAVALCRVNNNLNRLFDEITRQTGSDNSPVDNNHLGDKGRDRVTGYDGTATARYEYLSGHVRYILERMKNGVPEGCTFDAARIQWLTARDDADLDVAEKGWQKDPVSTG